jgi:uncharacterized repeat protein (TIGR01451 family)
MTSRLIALVLIALCCGRAAADTIATVAGDGTAGYGGDLGLATAAQLNGPGGVAVDTSGTVYVADTGNNRIRAVYADGTIATVAGDGTAGYGGDEGPAVAAQLNAPAGVVVDGWGNMLIADMGNNRIRMVDPAGNMHTIGGEGTVGYNADGISALAAQMSSPAGVCVTGDGNVIVADKANSRIRRIHAPTPVVHKAVSDAGPVCAGSALVYTLSWSNTGRGTAFDLTFTDTLPNGVLYSAPSLEYYADPDGAGTPALIASAYAVDAAGPWTAGDPPDGTGSPLVLRWVVDRVAPGRSAYIRYGVTVSATLATGDLVFGAASATIADDGGRVYATEEPSTAVTAVGTLAAALSIPAVIRAGDVFTVDLTVTNFGEGDVLGILPEIIPGPGELTVTTTGEFLPAGPANLVVGAWTTFSWSFTATGSGPVTFTATATGTTCGGASVLGIATVSVTVYVVPPVLHLEAIPPGPVCAGTTVTYSLSWSNYGCVTVYGITLTDTLPNGVMVSASSPEFFGETDWLGPPALTASAYATSSAGPWTPGMPPAGSGPPQVMRWVVDRVAPGRSGYIKYAVAVSATLATADTVFNKASATAMDDAGQTSESEEPTVMVNASGMLTAGLTTTAFLNPGQWFQVEFTVANSGTLAIPDVTAEIAVGPGAGLVDISGPIPPGPINLLPGINVTFAWSCTATAVGMVTFTATATGTACPGTISASASGACSIADLPGLDSTLVALPNPCNKGQTFHVVFTVTNNGTVDVTGLVPALLGGSGAGKSMVSAGPFPSGGVTVTAGSTVTFTWTCTATWEGSRVFSTSGTGTASGVPVTTGMIFSPALVIQLPAQLAVSGSLSSTMVSIGQTRVLSVVASNAGQAPLLIPAPPVLTWTGAGQVTLAGPIPSLWVAVAGGSTAVWSWTVTGLLAGSVDFTASVDGIDINTGTGFSATALAGSLMVYRSGLAAISLVAYPAEAPLDWTVSVTLTVRNTGTKTALVIPGTSAVLGDGRVLALTGPSPSQVWVGAGETAAFTWTFRTMRGGSASFQCGARDGDGNTAATLTSNTVRIVEAGRTVDDMIVYPNPFRPADAIGGTLKFRHLLPSSALALYTIGGETVAALTADLNGIVEWDGRNGRGTKVVPGVYVFILRAPNGAKKVGKIQVLP